MASLNKSIRLQLCALCNGDYVASNNRIECQISSFFISLLNMGEICITTLCKNKQEQNMHTTTTTISILKS